MLLPIPSKQTKQCVLHFSLGLSLSLSLSLSLVLSSSHGMVLFPRPAGRSRRSTPVPGLARVLKASGCLCGRTSRRLGRRGCLGRLFCSNRLGYNGWLNCVRRFGRMLLGRLRGLCRPKAAFPSGGFCELQVQTNSILSGHLRHDIRRPYTSDGRLSEGLCLLHEVLPAPAPG